MGLRSIIKLFEQGGVCVVGLRGRGKDMLMANVIVRRKLPYVSNMDYGGDRFPLDMEKIDCGKNTYHNFISGKLNRYVYPYPDKTDVYISDVGVYFPAQYCNELNKAYPYVSTFEALVRHVGDAGIHINCQSLGRIYDKMREQSDTYIMCLRCFYFHGLVIQKVRIYEDYESCKCRLKPFSVRPPLFSSNAVKISVKLQKEQYECVHGRIRERWLVYVNRSNYDTRHFREMLKEGGAL